MYVYQVCAEVVMDLGIVVKTDTLDSEDIDTVTSHISDNELMSCEFLNSTSTCSMPASSVVDVQTTSVTSTDCVVPASTTMSVGLITTSVVSASPKAADSAGPLKLVVAANSLRPVVPKSPIQVHSRAGQPTLIVGPALTVPSCSASPPRKMVTVLPAGVKSPSQTPLAVISARPVAASGQTVNSTTRSPAKVTVLSLPKTSSAPGQFVTVVSSSSATTAMSIPGVNSKPVTVPYKVLIRPSPAVRI